MVWQVTCLKGKIGGDKHPDGILWHQPEKTAEIAQDFLSKLPTNLILGVRINSWLFLCGAT